jgi:hypothetical protein
MTVALATSTDALLLGALAVTALGALGLTLRRTSARLVDLAERVGSWTGARELELLEHDRWRSAMASARTRSPRRARPVL